MNEITISTSLPFVNIIRYRSSKYGTQGILHIDNFQCYTLELPWYNNQHDISCIPPGLYYCKLFFGHRYRNVYQIYNVPNRSTILIHNGSFAGDRTKGLKSHTLGCILIGHKKTPYMIYQSRICLRDFMEYMDYQPFILNITDTVHNIQPVITIEI
jgi:hypothetical protein